MATRKSEPQYRAKPQGKAEPQAKAEPVEKAGSKDAGGLSRIFGDVANKTSLAAGRASAFRRVCCFERWYLAGGLLARHRFLRSHHALERHASTALATDQILHYAAGGHAKFEPNSVHHPLIHLGRVVTVGNEARQVIRWLSTTIRPMLGARLQLSMPACTPGGGCCARANAGPKRTSVAGLTTLIRRSLVLPANFTRLAV
jgi:hypothetical protein